MTRNIKRAALFAVAVLFSVVLGVNAQTTEFIGDPSQTDCENCQNGIGIAPSLGAAADFAVLGAATVTNVGPSILRGNLGTSPGTAITGFPPGIVVGFIYPGSAPATLAQADALLAYTSLTVQACDVNLTGQDLGGLTLTPGVYCFDTSAQLTGILTLDGLGDPDAVFVFQMGSTLTTASNASVVLVDEANACNVFWQVGSSATLGTDTEFQGTILALASITLNTGTNILGRAIALTGAVTLDTNEVTRCNFAPTAAAVSLGGRVTTAGGHGISMARITMFDENGTVRTAITSPFGFYNFKNVAVGQTYIVTVSHKSYVFLEPTLVVSMTDEIANANFVAN